MISRKITRTLTVVLVIFLLISATAAGFYFGFSYVLAQNSRYSSLQRAFEQTGRSPIDEYTPGSIEVIIPRASDTDDIAQLLESKKLINNTMLFVILSKFNGFDGSYIAGTHYLTHDLGYDEIMFILTQRPNPVKVTIPEGFTYTDVKKRLQDAGVKFDEKVLDSMVRSPNQFLDYKFVKEIRPSAEREWLLQGYLFPDTYFFDVNSDEETIIRTFLNNTELKLVQEYYDKAESMGMTIDEAITVASMIESEAADATEMANIGAVFRNRTNEGMTLSSCATINYLRAEVGLEPVLWLSNDQIDMFKDSAYNTYLRTGYPPGPINSPGIAAIEGALWPAQVNYKFFSATGEEDGGNVFAVTFEEHEANIARYQAQAESN
jgi:UPF0755 protein